MSKSAPAVAIGTAFGAAMVTALAQLGLASGLAILIWREANAESWAAHLTWAAWLTAASTVIGGTIGGRMATTATSRVTALLAAGVGGFVVAPLIAIPAMRFAESGISIAPFAAAGIGAFAGIAVTAAGLVSRAIAINVSVSIGLAWLLAGLSTFVPVGGLEDPIRLGIWGSWRELVGTIGTGALSVAPPLLLGSLLIGAVTAWVAGRSGGADFRVIALSGAAGPLLLVVGYIAAGQPEVGVDPQWNGIWAGVYATIAGLLGSLLVTALRKRPAPIPETATDSAAGPAVDPPYLRIDRDDAWAGTAADYEPPAASDYTQPVGSDYAQPTGSDNPRAMVDDDSSIMPPAPDVAPEPEPAAKKPKKKSGKAKADKAKKPRASKDAEPAAPSESPAEPVADGDESWVTGLRDPDNPDPYGFNELDEPSTEPEPEAKKRRFGRKKS